MTRTLVFAVLASMALAMTGALVAPAVAQEDSMNMEMGSGTDTSQIPRIPPVAGYAEGERIYFVHTEVSDAEIAEILTTMMGSPVPVVPVLAEASEEMLAKVYVFTNGVQPDGPRGPLNYQPDVFDRPVGAEGYTPLRQIMMVTWEDDAEPRVLTSAAKVQSAIENGEVSVERSGVVVNAPLVTWPGGER